jgi:hypothetical protein
LASAERLAIHFCRAAAGIVAGLVLGSAATRLVQSLLFEVKPTDSSVLIGALRCFSNRIVGLLVPIVSAAFYTWLAYLFLRRRASRKRSFL